MLEKVFIVNSESLGHGDMDLGRKMMGAFLRKLWANDNKPDAIILYNSGVKLAAKGSHVLDAMQGLHDCGVDLIACGTCVSHYGLENTVEAARVSGMEEIASILLTAKSVITV